MRNDLWRCLHCSEIPHNTIELDTSLSIGSVPVRPEMLMLVNPADTAGALAGHPAAAGRI